MKTLGILLAMLPLTASAHESHGEHLYQMLSHVFSSPEHVWPLTIGLALVVWLAFKKR